MLALAWLQTWSHHAIISLNVALLPYVGRLGLPLAGMHACCSDGGGAGMDVAISGGGSIFDAIVNVFNVSLVRNAAAVTGMLFLSPR
jgi:hypothetical protein